MGDVLGWDVLRKAVLGPRVTRILIFHSKTITFSTFFSGQEAEVEGTLSVQPQANPVRGFQEYFLNLTVENNERNPWFSGEKETEKPQRELEILP